MGFFEKLKRAFSKIKGKLIVASIMVLIISIWGFGPLSVAIKNGIDKNNQKVEYYNIIFKFRI